MSGLLNKILGGGDSKDSKDDRHVASGGGGAGSGPGVGTHNTTTGADVNEGENRLTSNYGGAQSGDFGGNTGNVRTTALGGIGDTEGARAGSGVGVGGVTGATGAGHHHQHHHNTGAGAGVTGATGATGRERDTGLDDRTATGYGSTTGGATSGHPSGFDKSSGGEPGDPRNIGQGENDAGRTAGGTGHHHHHHTHTQGSGQGIAATAAAQAGQGTGAGYTSGGHTTGGQSGGITSTHGRGGAGGFDGQGEGWNDSSMGAGVAADVGGASRLQGDELHSYKGEPGYSQGGHQDAANRGA